MLALGIKVNLYFMPAFKFNVLSAQNEVDWVEEPLTYES